jgi:hypothetical protein
MSACYGSSTNVPCDGTKKELNMKSIILKKLPNIVRCVCPLIALVLTSAAYCSEGEESELKNTVEVFLGAITETDPTVTGPGIGLEYNRRLSQLWSIGIEGLEISTSDISRSWALIIPVYLHPVGGLSLKLAPGWERSEIELPDSDETEHEFLIRAGIGWEFELGRHWLITPEANLDFSAGDRTWVFGASFGYRF